MALIKCPECGKEMSTEANSCPSCGYVIKEKKQQNSNNLKIIVPIAIVALVLIIGVICAIVIVPKIKASNEEKAKLEMYEEAVSLFEKGKIDKARDLFEELDGYEDSEEYLEKLSSNISGVSDQGYYNACLVIEMCEDSDYRKEMLDALKTVNEDNNFYSSSGDGIGIKSVEDSYKVADAIKNNEFFVSLFDKVDAIDCGGTNDDKLKDYVEGYIYLLIDNMWSENIEKDGDEISFAAMANLYVFISDDELFEQGLSLMGLERTDIEKLMEFENAISAFEKDFENAKKIDDISDFTWKLSAFTMFTNLAD